MKHCELRIQSPIVETILAQNINQIIYGCCTLQLLARLINRQDVLSRGLSRRSPQRFHCLCGQLRYHRHTKAESRGSSASIGRSATKKAILRIEKVRKFWLPTVSVGDPAARMQLPFRSILYVDSRGEQNGQLHVDCAQDDQHQ